MIECINIFIYDTSLPDVPTNERPFNYAKRDSVRLIYEGEDDKFIALFASRFELEIEVEIKDSLQLLHYSHLFSGEENRLKLVVTDQDGGIFWEGFLLPDQYQEPYTTGAFYVKIVATDGLGGLKGYTLHDSFYRSYHSIPSAIAKCLEFIPLGYDLYIDPALENEGAGRAWHEVYLNGASYLQDDKKASAYEVLESIVEELGATLHQQQGGWYVTGINRRNINTNSYYRYSPQGVYTGQVVSVENTAHSFSWEATPQVSLKPPFKKVEVATGIETQAALLVADIVKQPWIKSRQPQVPPPVRYWQETNNSGAGTISLQLYNTDRAAVPDYVDTPLEVPGFVGFQSINALNVPGVYDHYIALRRLPFVNKQGGKFTFRLKLKAVLYNNNEVPQVWPGGDANNSILYSLEIDGQPFISNRTDFINRQLYFLTYEEQIRNGFSYVSFSLEITLAEVDINGYLDFKLYNIDTAAIDDHLYIEDFYLGYDDGQAASYTKTRNLARTNKKEVTIKHGCSVMNNVKNAFIYQPDIPAGQLQEVPFTIADIVVSDQKIDGVLLLDTDDHSLIGANLDAVYIQKYGSDFYQYVEDIDANGSTLYYIINLYEHGPLTNYDKLFVRAGVPGNPQSTTIRNYRESWKKHHAAGFGRYGAKLAELYHDLYSGVLMAFEGRAWWVVLPADRVGQTVETLPRVYKSFMPVRIEIEFERNRTKITAIEISINNVADYV